MHVLLIDGLNLIRRVHAGVPERGDSDEYKNSVEEACIASLRRALRQHHPSHVLCVLDGEGPSWRSALFPDYKKSRQPMPDKLRIWITQIVERFDNEGVGTVIVSGVEADDLIASIALKIVEAGGRVTVLSTDKSFCQLLSIGISVYDHFSGQERDHRYVQERYGVEPDQLVDLFALAGDSSLDIPGIRGIGVRTAAKLLRDYRGLEDVFAAADGISGSLGSKIMYGKEAARLAYRLVALCGDASVGVNLKNFRYLAE
jgi:protein Xni